MRTAAFLILTAILAVALMAVAQDEDGQAAAADDDADTFAPSETVQADTAVVFPTDI